MGKAFKCDFCGRLYDEVVNTNIDMYMIERIPGKINVRNVGHRITFYDATHDTVNAFSFGDGTPRANLRKDMCPTCVSKVCAVLHDILEEASGRKENEVYNGGDDTHD